jgi:hypothetical protein
MDKKEIYFRGHENVCKFFSKGKKDTEIHFIGDLGDFIDVNNNWPVVLHIGKSASTFDREIYDLLFFKFIQQNVNRDIILTSFLSADNCWQKCSIYEFFKFSRLPNSFEDGLIKNLNNPVKALLKLADEVNFKNSYLRHEVNNFTFDHTVYSIFEKNKQQYEQL